MADELLPILHGVGDVDVPSIARLAVAQTPGQPLERGVPRAFLIPDGYTLDVREPDRTEVDEPRRILGTVHLHTPAALIDYFNEHDADSGEGRIYADVNTLRIVGVIDDDTAGFTPGWRQHRVVVELQPTPEWAAWTGRDGQLSDQVSFGEFLEQHSHEIIHPDAATMIETARTLEAKRNVQFRSVQNPKSGELSFLYDEQIEGSARRGDMTVPDTFTVRAGPFYGADEVELTARFRYRLRDGELKVGYHLLHVDRILRQAFDDVLDGVEAETGVLPRRGIAPSPRTVADAVL